MAICKINGCTRSVGRHGAKGMCPKHYQESRVEVRTCSRCGETKKFYNNSGICKACLWWEKHHGGEKRNSPIRIRDGFASRHREEYRIYSGIKTRCQNPNCEKYESYGGRGINVCERWSGPLGFHHFYEDMGSRPSRKYSIDRIDVDGDYCPENCRWATLWEQSQNKQNKRMYSRHIGVTYNKAIGRWVATLTTKGKVHAKYAKTEDEAVLLRKQLEKDYLL